MERKSKAVTVTSNMFQDLSREDDGEIDDASKETWPTRKESKDGKILNKGAGGKSKGKGKSKDKHVDRIQGQDSGDTQSCLETIWKRGKMGDGA